MAASHLHPLRVWLMSHSVTVVDFSARHDLSFRALYDQFEGRADPRLSTLLAIEKATKREVKVQDIADWFRTTGFKK